MFKAGQSKDLLCIWNPFIMNKTEISQYVKSVREKLGLTQFEFAKLIPKERYVISDYETGRSIPPGDVLLKIQELERTSEPNK